MQHLSPMRSGRLVGRARAHKGQSARQLNAFHQAAIYPKRVRAVCPHDCRKEVQGQHWLRDRIVLCVPGGTIFLALVFLAPVLVDDVGGFGEPLDVFGEIGHLDRSEKLEPIARGAAEGFKKPGGNKDWYVVRLEIECAGSLLDGQAGRRLAKQGKEMALVIFHNFGPCWAARPTGGPSLPLAWAIVRR